MRVLFLVEDATLNGGTEILARNLAESLNENGVECRLVSAVECRNEGPLRQILAKLATEWRADWIVCHTYDLCADVPTDGPWKTAQVFNWSIEGYETAYLRGVNARPLFNRILSRVKFEIVRYRWHRALANFTRLIVLTDAGRGEVLAANRKVCADQLVTIADPLMQTEDSEILSSLENKQVAFVGRLSAEKGVMRLLRIWKRVQMHLPDYALAVYGCGSMRREMEMWLANEGCGLKVVFKGFEKDLGKIYPENDLLLMTSDTEGFGMVLIEAMYYGVPCVSFDCPVSPKEIIGHAGFTVPCFDEDAYATEVAKLLQDRERLRACQSAAIVRARDFGIEKVVASWKELF